jgi:flagellar biosynthesis GTPase FlhF
MKIRDKCSSPSCLEWDSFVKGTKTVLVHSQLQEQELHIHQERRVEEQERKVKSRKVIQKFGGLTSKDAQRKLDEIERKEKEKEAKKQQKQRDDLLRDEKKRMYREGVNAREQERARKRKVKAFEAAKQDVPPKLLIPIPDPEKIWLAQQEEMKLQEEIRLQLLAQQEEEVTIITDTVGDQSLRPQEEDYIALPSIRSDEEDDNSTLGLEDSELYDSDMDYSWNRRK